MSGGTSLSPAALKAFLDGPSTIAPKGVKVNLDNPHNWNAEVYAVAAICLLLATGATLARLYSRAVVTKKLHLEDYLGLAAYLPFLGVAWAVFDFGHQAGYFVHQWDLRGRVLIPLGINSMVVGLSYCLVMIPLKTAILLEWNRIFALHRTNAPLFWISMFLIVLNVGSYFSGLFSLIFACIPVEKSWHFWLAGKCIDRRTRDVFNAAVNLIVDIFVFVLPQRILWKLHMSQRRKVGISVVFSVGLLVIALAAGRLYSTITIDYVKDASRPTDRTYKFSQTIIWAFAEITCIFLVFCVPALPKLFAERGIISQIASSLRSWTRIRPRGTGSSSSAKESGNSSWRRNISGDRPGRYRLRDEESKPESQTELSVIQDVYVQPGMKKDRDGQGHMGEPGITKTVEFDHHHDDAASRTSEMPIVKKQQHPWMQ
ncbi:hypothetical protein B0J11DRAFT_520121 [Dendryphion nanum]|uniref:Rhodopsin domain-containing protein n=1 Tax=Dendryphion nanum TaxID=256645 RepID=A0A9P9E8A4_9PLEO|nr:hypothetical protein B0J11DRAFT_520121 [Dendryphion nanum]